MLCVTGSERTLATLSARIGRLAEAALHEVRLDLLDEAPLRLIGRLPDPQRLIVTVRAAREGGGWRGPEEKRVALLREAIDRGVGYVDVEASTPPELLEPLLSAAGATRRIVSVHLGRGDEETPLNALARLGSLRAHVLKLALPVEDAADLCALRDAAAQAPYDVLEILVNDAQYGPYPAYYYTQRYQDVLNLANTTLSWVSQPVLEETYFWRGMAQEALGNLDRAISDYKRSATLNSNYALPREALQRLGVPFP